MGYGRGQTPSHLGEGDWLEIAEKAYTAWYWSLDAKQDYMACLWSELDRVGQDAWVAAVKETSEQLKSTGLR